MSPQENNPETERRIQVGLLMKAYRESFVREDSRKGITQTELLRRMGLVNPYYSQLTSHGTVSRWETGDTLLTTERIQTFGKALNLSQEQLYGIILLAGLDPIQQESRTLSCQFCGHVTIVVQTQLVQSQREDKPITHRAIRTRKCPSCDFTSESTERWSNDPVETGNEKLRQIMANIGRAIESIQFALKQVETVDYTKSKEADNSNQQS